MGLFNNYMKEGPGVDVNAPKKKGIFLFFEVLGRKFFPLIKANIMYFLVSLPMFAIALLVLAPQFTATFIGSELSDADAMTHILFDLFFAGFIFNYIGSGPASAAYAFITRSFTRSEPVWVVSDGFDKFKENFKYAILLVIVDIVVTFTAVIAIRFYMTGTNIMMVFLYFFVMIVYVIYSLAHMFMYQIMVTYDCKFGAVIKNSIILTFAKLPMVILLGIVTAGICALIFTYLGILSVFVYAVIGMTFTKFPLEFYAARVIEKNIEKTKNNETQGDVE